MSKCDNAILSYYQQIQNGGVTVGKWVRDWYARIVKGLEEKRFFFDQHKAGFAIDYIERYCRHHEGTLAPGLIKLELWQKAMVSVMFGIVDDSGCRQFREVFVVIGRKNGKTLLAAAIANLMSVADGEYGARVYFCAPKLDQARLCYDAFYQMVAKEEATRKRCQKRRTDIYFPKSNTSVMPIPFSGKKSDGLNPQLCVCDEVAAWVGDPGLKQYEVLKSALGARRQPMILSISTAGYVNDGIYDELMKRSTAVISGSSKETRLAPFLYMVDSQDRWNDINELKKANPNLGVSVSVDYMLEEISVAESSLSKRNEFLVKYCNLKQNSSCAFLDYQTVEQCASEKTIEDFRDHYCVMGLDLSQTTDLTAATLLIEKDDVLYAHTQFFMPQDRIDIAEADEGVPYHLFVQKGLVQISGEHYIDFHDVVNWMNRMRSEYGMYIQICGYDKWSAQYAIEDIKASGVRVDDVRQGENLSPVIREFEGILKDGRFKILNNSLLQSHFLNVAVEENTESRKVKAVKIDKRSHIDGFVSVIDAMCVRQKWFNSFGEILANK